MENFDTVLCSFMKVNWHYCADYVGEKLLYLEDMQKLQSFTKIMAQMICAKVAFPGIRKVLNLSLKAE